MTQEIQWGPAIAVDGKRPGWLEDGVRIIPTVSGRDNFEPRFAECHGWSYPLAKTTAIRLPADHPYYRQTEAAPIDWSGELEAVHEDGRVVSVTLAPNEHGYSGFVPRVTNECPAEDTNDNWYEDGTDFCRNGKWRIRNVLQPTPQADTKPDLMARMTLAEAEARGELCGCCTGREGYVQCLRDLGLILPEPVDPDEAEAQRLNDDSPYDLTGLDEQHAARNVRYIHATILAAIKRGRALALAGEKEA